MKNWKDRYVKSRFVYHRAKFYYSVNWMKTLYFNFKKFPFQDATKLPVFFYGKVKFQNISAKICIDAPLKRGMIGFGQPYEMNTLHKGIAELVIKGTIVFKGNVQFGKDYFIYVAEKGYCEFGNMSSLGSNGKIICIDKIILGDYARLGSECQIIDTNFHQMIDTNTNYKFKMNAPIVIGDYNYIGNRVSIMQETLSPNYCTIASNSLCNKDYSSLGNNILIGGIPAKLLKNNISRDWEVEKAALDAYLMN